MEVLNLPGIPATECERRAGVFDPCGEAQRFCAGLTRIRSLPPRGNRYPCGSWAF